MNTNINTQTNPFEKTNEIVCSITKITCYQFSLSDTSIQKFYPEGDTSEQLDYEQLNEYMINLLSSSSYYPTFSKENEVNMIDADVLCDMTCAHKLETDLTDEIKQKSNLVGIRCLESNSFCCEVTNTILEYIIYNFATKQFLTREERDNLYETATKK